MRTVLLLTNSRFSSEMKIYIGLKVKMYFNSDKLKLDS